MVQKVAELRGSGRADDFEAVEFIAHQSPVEATIAERGDTTVVASARSGAAGRLGSHAIAALFVILLTAFGTFCRYYPWKMPATAAPLTEAVATTPALQQLQTPEDGNSRKAANQKRVISGPVKDISLSRRHVRKSMLRS